MVPEESLRSVGLTVPNSYTVSDEGNVATPVSTEENESGIMGFHLNLSVGWATINGKLEAILMNGDELIFLNTKIPSNSGWELQNSNLNR